MASLESEAALAAVLSFFPMAIDIMMILCLAYGFYFGFTQRVMHGAGLLIFALLGLALAIRYVEVTAELLRQSFAIEESTFLPIIAFGINAFSLLLILRLLSLVLQETFTRFKFSFFNRLFGGLIMAAVFVFLYSNLVAFFEGGAVITENTKEKSAFYGYLETLPKQDTILVDKLRPVLEDFWREMTAPLRADNIPTTTITEPDTSTTLPTDSVERFPLPIMDTTTYEAPTDTQQVIVDTTELQ